MQILRVLTQTVTLYGICALHEDSDVRYRYGQKIVIVIFSSLLFLLMLFSLAEMLHQFEIGDTFSCLFASSQLVSSLSAIGCYLPIILKMKKVRHIFNELQNITDKCNFSENQIINYYHYQAIIFVVFTGDKTPSAAFYLRASKLSENYIGFFGVRFNIMFIVSSLIFAAGSVIICYIRHGNVIEMTNFYLPLKLR